jgi:hypothetical protein
MKICRLILIVVSLAYASALAQDPGIQDSLILGSAEVDSSGSYQTADIPVYAVTDDSVSFVCIPLRWHPADGAFIDDVAYRWPFDCPDGDNWDTLFFDRGYFLIILWADLMHDTLNDCILYTFGQRLHVFTLRIVIPPNTPRGSVSFDTCWDVRNGGLAFGLVDGLTQILPGFQRGFLAIGPETGIGEEEADESPPFQVVPNYPNPFWAKTEISFAVAKPGIVKMSIYNITGQEMLHREGYYEAGRHTFHWDGADVPSGVYFYRIESGGKSETRKMVLLK